MGRHHKLSWQHCHVCYCGAHTSTPTWVCLSTCVDGALDGTVGVEGLRRLQQASQVCLSLVPSSHTRHDGSVRLLCRWSIVTAGVQDGPACLRGPASVRFGLLCVPPPCLCMTENWAIPLQVQYTCHGSCCIHGGKLSLLGCTPFGLVLIVTSRHWALRHEEGPRMRRLAPRAQLV
jgi:hypothetical protein